MKHFVVFNLMLLGMLCLARAETNDFERSVVEVLVTYQKYDPHFPWRNERPGVRHGYGVVIGKGRVLTTEALVRNHTLVELRRAKSGLKITATVIQADYQVGAALLGFEEARAVAELKPVPLAPRVERDAKVQIVQFDNAGQVQTGEGQVVEISIGTLLSGPVQVLTLEVRSDLNISRQGTPVFLKGKLAGLVLRSYREKQVSIVVPACSLKRFIADTDDPPYKGLAVAGYLWMELIDPAKRSFLGIPAGRDGILVVKTMPCSSAADVLKNEDVIMEWDRFPIDSLGYYNDPDYGRLLFSYLINGRHKPGDTVPVKVIRDRRVLDLKVKLDALDESDALIPENIVGEQVEYVVDGGLVIRELTAHYLHSYGLRWKIAANPRLVHLYLTLALLPDKVGDRVVILSSVLPDIINIGYHGFRDEVITRINGEKILNMSDVFRIIDRDGGARRISLQSMGLDLVLDPKTIATANQRLAATYRIPHLRFQRKQK